MKFDHLCSTNTCAQYLERTTCIMNDSLYAYMEEGIFLMDSMSKVKSANNLEHVVAGAIRRLLDARIPGPTNNL